MDNFSDSDSDRSQEMFSDDELDDDTIKIDSLRNDASFASYLHSPVPSGNSLPEINNRSAQIPTTPLSLAPFISKAQVWTKDLETPVLKKKSRRRYSSPRKICDKIHPLLTDKSDNKQHVCLDTLTPDEIIPASPAVEKKKRHFNSNRSRSSSFKDNSTRYDSFDESDLESKNENQLATNAQFNCTDEQSSVEITERVMKLEQLQKKQMKRKNYECISNKEFQDTLIRLVYPQQMNNNQSCNLQKLQSNKIGFISFSEMSHNIVDDQMPVESNKNIINNKIYGKFQGFSPETQNKSQICAIKFHGFLHEKEIQSLEDSSKSHQSFQGFSKDEITQSQYAASKFKSSCDEYIDKSFKSHKLSGTNSRDSHNTQCDYISPLSLHVNSGFKTACGEEIFIDIDIIYKSKLSFIELEKKMTNFSIDELTNTTCAMPSYRNEKILSQNSFTINQKNNKNSDDINSHGVKLRTTTITDYINVTETSSSSSKIEPTKITNNEFKMNFTGGFKTAGGTCLKVSEEALKQAYQIYSQCDDELIDEKIKNNTANKFKLPLTNKTPIPLNQKMPMRNDERKKNNMYETISNINIECENENEFKMTDVNIETPVVGFQTGHGKNIGVSKDALLKAQAAFLEDFDNDTTDIRSIPSHSKDNSINLSNLALNDSLNKRKFTADDNTPVGRKKVRTGSELQRRKLFLEIEEEEKYLAESNLLLNDVDTKNVDRNVVLSPLGSEEVAEAVNASVNSHTNFNFISDEVRESIAALLKDEEFGNEELEQESNINSDGGQFIKSRRSDGLCLQKANRHLMKRSKSLPDSINENVNTINNPSETKNSTKTSYIKPTSPKCIDIPEDLDFDSPPFEESTNPQTLERNRQKRLAAIKEQQTSIKLKRTQKLSEISEGSLIHLKQMNNGISLKDYFNTDKLVNRTSHELIDLGINPNVLSINSITAMNYQFRCVEFFGHDYMNKHYNGIPIGDGAILIPNNDNLVGIEEFKQAFLASPNVDPTLIPDGWIENHYRWIVWKLASMDRLKAGGDVPVRFLTPDKIMKQLKYRYDREINRAQRPALRRILEKDDAPSQRLILCVSQIFILNNNDNNSTFKSCQKAIELTDGWYAIPVTIDCAMHGYIKKGKIQVGTKLMVFGAELLNHSEGCCPLKMPSNVRLRIHSNSTRRVKWYSKLGYQRQSGPMLLTLKSINSNGGLIGKLLVSIARIYPIIYREKVGNGQFIDRNAKCEEKIAIAFEDEYQSRIEDFQMNRGESTNPQSRKEIEQQLLSNLPSRRDVVPITKMKVADNNYAAMITLWSGAEESQRNFHENTHIMIYSAMASGRKWNELQLTTNRFTIFRQVVAAIASHIVCLPRCFTSLDNIYLTEFQPHYGEFDTVGLIVSVGPAPHGMKNFETVNLAITKNINEDARSFYLSILFWQGISSYGFAEIATVGSFIACSNLEFRKNTYKSIPTAFCTERTILTRNPKQQYLSQPLEDLRTKIRLQTDVTKYITNCNLEIQNEVMRKSKPISRNLYDDPERSEPRDSYTMYNSSLNNDGINESRYGTTPNNNPGTSLRSTEMKNRMNKLQNYGTPPALSPIFLPQSAGISSDYRSPIPRVPLSAKRYSK